MTPDEIECKPGVPLFAPNAVRGRLALLLGKMGEGLMGSCEGDFHDIGLDGRDYTALAVLDEERPSSQLELAQLTGTAPAVVVAIVDALEKEGFALRERDPADRRRSIVRITDKGRTALAEADALAIQAEDVILGGLDEDERAQLHDLLRRAVTPAATAHSVSRTKDGALESAPPATVAPSAS